MNNVINVMAQQITHMKKYTLLLILMFTSHWAFATCVTNSGGASPITITVSQPVISVQRDIPVGSILKTITTTIANSVFSSCNTSGSIYYKMGIFNVPSGISHVYNTNIPGVGISIDQPSVGGTDYWYENPPGVRSVTQSASVAVTTFIVNLVKTGDIQSGPTSSGVVGTVYANDGVTAVTINFVGGQVSQLACSINTPTLTFPIGDIPVTTFGTTVGTTPSGAQNVQNLGLTCDAGANINITLNGTQNPDVPGNTSVLSLTGQGSNGVATGVGVQLLYGGSPLVLNNRLMLRTSAGGQETVSLTARYYQTKAQVTTGDASASATLQLTYQ
jgi:hypothetical protein